MNVYFIKTEAIPPMLKIGKARSPKDRLETLQTGCPYELKLIGVIQCRSDLHAQTVEKRLHGHFQAERTRGEWFRYSDRVARIVAGIVGRPDKQAAAALTTPIQGKQFGGVLNKRERWREYERQKTADALAGLEELDRQFREAINA